MIMGAERGNLICSNKKTAPHNHFPYESYHNCFKHIDTATSGWNESGAFTLSVNTG